MCITRLGSNLNHYTHLCFSLGVYIFICIDEVLALLYNTWRNSSPKTDLDYMKLLCEEVSLWTKSLEKAESPCSFKTWH